MYIAEHNKAPVIIFDLYALPFYMSHIVENLYGGRSVVLRNEMIKFFSQLKQYNVQMYFVRCIDECGKPIEKSKNYEIEELEIVRSIARCEEIKEIFSKNMETIPWLGKIELREVSEMFGVTKFAPSFENMWCYVGALARKLNAFAVVSDKTNMAFYENPEGFRLWLARKLNLNTMETVEVNVLLAAKLFDYPVEQFPLIGIFIAPSFCRQNPSSKLSPPFNHIIYFAKKFFYNNIPKFIEFVKGYDESTLYLMLKKVYCDVHYNVGETEFEKDLATLTQYYGSMRIKDIPPEDPLLTFVKQYSDIQVYRTILNGPYYVKCSFFDDFRYNRSYVKIMKGVLSRRSGVLLNHQKDKLLTRVVYTEQMKSMELRPILPKSIIRIK